MKTNMVTQLELLWTTFRPVQWIKNLVVFAVPVFGLVLDPEVLLDTGLTFILFCLAASSIYTINDILDREKDRQNPLKKHRPIAAGKLSIKTGIIAAILLSTVSLSAGYRYAPTLGLILLCYILLQISYSLWLKRRPIIDLLVISAGFVLRVLSGTVTADTYASSWLLLSMGLLALFLGIEKRKAELQHLPGGNSRSVLHHYSLSLLSRMESITASAALIVYTLWALEGPRSDWMLLTVPFVVYGIFRYQLLSEDGEQGEDPADLFLKSPSLMLTVLLWGIGSLTILLLTTG